MSAIVDSEFRIPRWYVAPLTISGAFALTVCGELILAVLAGVEVVVVLVVMVFDVVVDAVADSDVVVATLFAPPYPSWAGGR